MKCGVEDANCEMECGVWSVEIECGDRVWR